MKISEDVNKYGTPVSVHKCEDCGNEFTVYPSGDEDWGGCQAESCTSYGIALDTDQQPSPMTHVSAERRNTNELMENKMEFNERVLKEVKIRCRKHGICTNSCTSDCNSGERLTPDEMIKFGWSAELAERHQACLE